MEKRICRNCGKEDYEHMMHRFNTGRVQYMCIECYKAGLHEVGMHNQKKAAKKEKEKNE